MALVIVILESIEKWNHITKENGVGIKKYIVVSINQIKTSLYANSVPIGFMVTKNFIGTKFTSFFWSSF